MPQKMFKRGISPLVATILLISVAISIGATVMSFGGTFYESVRTGKSLCSKAVVSAFTLENGRECQNYESESIINFYKAGENVETPNCYKQVGTGRGNLCLGLDEVFNNTWIPIKNLIR